MSAGETTAVRTYLEMTDPQALRAGRPPAGKARITRREPCAPEFWRYLYTTVGAGYQWLDRLSWTDDDARRYLTDAAVSLWVLTVDDAVAGYYELRREDDASVEIVYFGLLPEFTGRGLGGYLLTDAVERAWASRRPPRVAAHVQLRSPLRYPELPGSRLHRVQDGGRCGPGGVTPSSIGPTFQLAMVCRRLPLTRLGQYRWCLNCHSGLRSVA